jgi:hypothetical protein
MYQESEERICPYPVKTGQALGRSWNRLGFYAPRSQPTCAVHTVGHSSYWKQALKYREVLQGSEARPDDRSDGD